MRSSSWVRFIAVAFIMAIIAPAGAHAQFNAEKKYFGVHAGLSGYGSTAAFGVNGEMSYNERITIGGFANTWSYGQSVAGFNWDVRYIAVAATGSYHFPIKDRPKLDPFLGASLGYYIVSTSGTGLYTGTAASAILVGGYGGVRYFFRENIGAVARLGVGGTYLAVGVDFGI